MIEEKVKLHDKFSAELKLGFYARKQKIKNNFTLNIWMFIPASLDINRFTYSKENFYKDLKSNIRLITPTYILREIVDGENTVLQQLKNAFILLASEPTSVHKAQYENQIKMFLSILKSSLREDVIHTISSDDKDIDNQVENYLKYINKIAIEYRALYHLINVTSLDDSILEHFKFGDEFLTNVIEFQTFRLMDGLKDKHHESFLKWKKPLLSSIEEELRYKKEKGYDVVKKDNLKKNSVIVFKLSMLKKYVESHLFLDIDKQKDGQLAEQLLFSVAAGISMIFATFVAFYYQQKYGNFTMPFFLALVISYILKDRIKEFFRFYLAHKVSSKYYDYKIDMSLNQSKIGWIKESMDFIPEQNIPPNILLKRNRSAIIEATNRSGSEQVLLYRSKMYLDRQKLDQTSSYFINGVNSIIRFNVTSFIRNMDNLEFPLYYPDSDDGFVIVKGEKFYYLNLVVQKISDEQDETTCYRIALNRNGIYKIEKL